MSGYPMKCKCGAMIDTEGENIAHDCDYYPADIMAHEELWGMKCTDCEMKIDQWSVFPEGRCINCHALEFDSNPLPTAQDIRDMWGIK
jgi:hypothetical protein